MRFTEVVYYNHTFPFKEGDFLGQVKYPHNSYIYFYKFNFEFNYGACVIAAWFPKGYKKREPKSFREILNINIANTLYVNTGIAPTIPKYE